MTDDQITLVTHSWQNVEPIAPTAATLFYDRLFTVAPGVRPLFGDDLTEQRRKLMEMIGTVVDGLDKLDQIVPEVQDLGRRLRDSCDNHDRRRQSDPAEPMLVDG